MKSIATLLGVALFAKSSLQHGAMLPPNPDKALTRGSSTAPAGCKLLASDKGFPSNETVKAALPGAIFKQWGTEGPDWIFQAKNVKDVQSAVNFAREKNVRLSILTTGHDFHGRGAARSGLRLDLSTFNEPIVFSPSYTPGKPLLPPPTIACPIATPGEEVCPAEPAADVAGTTADPNYVAPDGITRRKFNYYHKRDGLDCATIRKRKCAMSKRHEPGEAEPVASAAGYNIIKPVAGQQAVARVAAGMYQETFYEAADKSGLFVMGAQHGGVGTIGGWAQAGGHNPFINEYGFMADQILEFEVVTADGKFVKANNKENSDLYWALRGGGGGTFGVVTAATIKVYPTPPIVVGRFFVNSTTPALWDAVAYFMQQGPKIRDQYGAQGYFYIYKNAFQSVLHFPNKHATEANARAAFEPLIAKMNQLAGATPQPVKYYTYKTYKEWFIAENGNDAMEDSKEKFLAWYDGSDGDAPGQSQAMENPLSVLPWVIKYPQHPSKRSLGSGYYSGSRVAQALNRRQEMVAMVARPNSRHYLDSRLLSDKHVNSLSQSELGKLLNKTLPGIPNNHIRGFLYGGGEQAKPAKDAMGLNPAWRDATYHFITNAVPGDVRNDYDMTILSKQWPDAGGYVNEAAPQEKNWKQVFFGSNYPKLEQIKKKYDPKNVLWCTPCVGADLLTYDDERICSNPAGLPAGVAAPQTLPNMQSKTGIASLPGVPGIANPLMPIILEMMATGKVPSTMREWDANGVLLPEEHAHTETGATAETGHSHGAAAASSSLPPAGASAIPIPASSASAASGHSHDAAGTMAAPAASATTAAMGHSHGAASSIAAPAPAASPAPASSAAPANPLAGLLAGLRGSAAPAASTAAAANPFAGLLAGLQGLRGGATSAAATATATAAAGHSHGGR